MSVSNNLKLSVFASAMSVAMGAWAVPLTTATLGGVGAALSHTYLPCNVNQVCAGVPTQVDIDAALTGAGNVELSKLGGPVATLTGTFSDTGLAITLSSLVLADWTNNGNALAKDYIQDAWLSLFPMPLTAAQLNSGAAMFISNNVWRSVSDPNVSYVDDNGGVVHIGLDGLLDATSFLNALALSMVGSTLPPGMVAQASEVVKVTYKGMTDYLYGFDAVPTGYVAQDGQSYTGVYEVTIPEPSAMWLLGIGLIGLLASRRR